MNNYFLYPNRHERESIINRALRNTGRTKLSAVVVEELTQLDGLQAAFHNCNETSIEQLAIAMQRVVEHGLWRESMATSNNLGS